MQCRTSGLIRGVLGSCWRSCSLIVLLIPEALWYISPEDCIAVVRTVFVPRHWKILSGRLWCCQSLWDVISQSFHRWMQNVLNILRCWPRPKTHLHFLINNMLWFAGESLFTFVQPAHLHLFICKFSHLCQMHFSSVLPWSDFVMPIGKEENDHTQPSLSCFYELNFL